MLRADVSFCEDAFQTNLSDWCAGGPNPRGWTRTGPLLSCPAVRLSGSERREISVADGLAKNRAEVQEWHIDFLKRRHPLEATRYYTDYLLPRFDARTAAERAARFLRLFRSMETSGFNGRFPVLVADVSVLNLGFWCFRFDGCHRLACAEVLGIERVPAYVFRSEGGP